MYVERLTDQKENVLKRVMVSLVATFPSWLFVRFNEYGCTHSAAQFPSSDYNVDEVVSVLQSRRIKKLWDRESL